MRRVCVFLLILHTILLISCEKPIVAEGESSATSAHTSLTLSIYQLEQTSFSSLTRSTLSDICSRLNFAVYDLDGNRLKQVNQKVGDNNFGTATFELPNGSYQMVVLAHSSDGNPTMTNPSKIQFTNAQSYSETFLYYTTVSIGDEAQTLALSLRRIVALCRFVVSDAIPTGVARLEFTYKGGSGHFDAKTGFGVTKSTQVVKFNVREGQQQTQYDLYTFLHNTEDTIHLNVVAYDTADHSLFEREFDIPMEQNKVTWMTGEFFTGVTPTTSQSFITTITINNAWSGEQHLTY